MNPKISKGNFPGGSNYYNMLFIQNSVLKIIVIRANKVVEVSHVYDDTIAENTLEEIESKFFWVNLNDDAFTWCRKSVNVVLVLYFVAID